MHLVHSWIHHVTDCMGEWAEIHNRSSNRAQLHHHINQAFPILNFLMYFEIHGKTWVQGYALNAQVSVMQEQGYLTIYLQHHPHTYVKHIILGKAHCNYIITCTLRDLQ